LTFLINLENILDYFAREFLPKINYKPRIELMNPMLPGLMGNKMSASIPSSKIDILDDEKTIVKKIKSAEFIAGKTDSGIMKWLKYIIFPILEDKKQSFKIIRNKKYGGNLSIKNYEELELKVTKNKIHPLDIKIATAREINSLLSKVQKNKKLIKLYKDAYLV